MEYREEWQKIEDLADKDVVYEAKLTEDDSHNRSEYNLQDAQIMFAWLRYAATIGDLSYMKIYGPLPPFPDMKRPTPFHPVEG